MICTMALRNAVRNTQWNRGIKSIDGMQQYWTEPNLFYCELASRKKNGYKIIQMQSWHYSIETRNMQLYMGLKFAISNQI